MEITQEMVSRGQRALGMAMMESGYSGVPIDPEWIRAALNEAMDGDLSKSRAVAKVVNNNMSGTQCLIQVLEPNATLDVGTLLYDEQGTWNEWRKMHQLLKAEQESHCLYFETTQYAARRSALQIKDLLKALKHVVQWHDQLSAEDLKSYQELIEAIDWP